MRYLLTAVFALSGFLLLWCHFGYPVFIALLARRRPRPLDRRPFTPSVSLVIPAYNEEACIARKLENALQLDYAADLLEIIVVADGSSDRTVEIVKSYEPRGVRLLFQPERQGKIAAMNRAVPATRAEIVVFSDANAMMERDGIREIVSNFADPEVGCAGGEKRIRQDGAVQAEGESLYWRYEAFIKRADSLANTAIGAIGEFIAIRRELYRPLETDSLVEDFVLSMQLVMEGWRVVYDDRAVTWETASPTLGGEWARRVRVAAGGFQAMRRLRGLLSPKYGLAAFQYFSHKVLRWLAPFFLMICLVASALGFGFDALRWAFLGQAVFYSLALMGWGMERLDLKLKPIRVIFYFCFGNAAVFVGFIRYVTRTQSVLWSKAR
jgi:cellulose synthase/poly-beta-1,6-N-acetylglucosamine synthase-like glycosyltransferase